MRQELPYQILPEYVLRTPLFSFDAYKDLTSAKVISENDLKEICKEPVFQEALYLASPSLFKEIDKWLRDGITDKEKLEKLQYAALKYFSRMTSRCTPFGLFAGCTLGKFGESTKIELKEHFENKRHTRLDMNYLVSLAQNLVDNPKIRKQLLFYPNSSIYVAGNQLRYVEYQYINAKRVHQISAVDNSSYIQKVLEHARNGALLSEMSQLLVDDDISIEEASDFLEELVDSQLLVSELEPSVSGPEFLEQMLSVLNQKKGLENVTMCIEEVQRKLDKIDQSVGNSPDMYAKVGEFIKDLETDYDPKYLFQVDLILENEVNRIDQDIIEDLKKGLAFLNNITLHPRETLLSKFKEAFYERYEGREVPMAKALDTEMGLGYRQNRSSGDTNPLVDDIVLEQEQSGNSAKNVTWTTIDSLFQKKLLEAYKNNSYSIVVEDADFEGHKNHWDDLPDTISCMIELIKENGKEKIRFKGGGGSSGANLLGRFCHGDKKLHGQAKRMVDIEHEANKDKIVAEIVHLPESRVGNILMRPDFRNYEIPYLAKSTKPLEYQLPLDDLLISIRNNRIVLRSKKFDKEVVPRLTNAHNYSNNALPVYHFLSDMQHQDIRGGVGFSLDKFAEDFEFFPRIEYHNLILSEATWNIAKHRIEELIQNKDNEKVLLEKVKDFRKGMKMPQFVKLIDGDNELLINLENLTSVKMWLDLVGKRSGFRLTEFLHAQEGVVTKNGAPFTNQIIVSFYNKSKLNVL